MTEQTPIEIPAELPVLALRDLVVFPFMIAPIRVGRTKSIRAIEARLGHARLPQRHARRQARGAPARSICSRSASVAT